MSRVVWTPQAIADLEAIRDYIHRDSEKYASLVGERIIEAVGSLESFPLSGRVVPECGDEYLRELLWNRYRIVYRVAGEEVVVVTIFHGARLVRIP